MRKITMLVSSMLLLLSAYAQNITVKGKITDPSGAPLSGATVNQKGTKNSVVADNQGNYQIKVPNNATLVVSDIGFLTLQAQVKGDMLNLTMQPDIKSLSEVVVTGVGAATSKRKVAIAVETITADKLPAAPTASIDQALVGKVPGALITSVNGNPGRSVNILLRGINTLQSGTFPMILLDGIEVRATDFNSLDLTAIERVEVIQGAAAATLYGAQGANGVIQLFTKKAKSGRLNIDVSSSIARNSLINVKDNLQKARYHSLATNGNNEVLGSSGAPLVFDQALSHYAENVIWNSVDPTNNNNKEYNKNLQWYDHNAMFYQTATTYNNSVSISAAKDKFDFLVAASDSRQESVFKGNGKYSRSNITANIGVELFKNLRFRSTSQLVYTDNRLVDPDGRTIVYALNNSRPFANYEYKSPDGNYGAYFGDGVGVNGYNPNYMFQYGHPRDEKTDIIQNFNLNYKFPRFLEADVKYGINYLRQGIKYQIDAQDNNLNADYWQYWLEYYSPRYSAGAPSVATESGEINVQDYKQTFQNFLPSLTLRFDLNKDFGLKLPIRTISYGAFDYRKNINTAFLAYGTDAPSFTPFTMSNMANQKIVTETKTPFVTYGYLFDQKIEFGELFTVAGGFRTDYSSAFGAGSKPFTFPHYNGSFRPSSLKFWSSSAISSVIPEWKLRAAYGKAGIQPGAFQRYVTLNTNSMGDNVAFAFKVASPNPNLSVEVSEETEIGTDLSLKILKNGGWLNSGSLSFSYWKRKTDNAIWQADAAPSTGIGTITDNLFGLKSHGIQASLNLEVLSTKNFTWNMTTNFGRQSSEISFVKDKPVVVTSNAGSTGIVLKAGEKIGQLYGYLMLHSVDQIDPTTGQPFIAPANQKNFVVASNGWVVYSDPTSPNYKQPYVTPNQYSFGDPNPKFNMTFINDLTYKGFLSFSMQWDWLNGSHLYNQTKEWMYRDGIHKDFDNPITIGNSTGAWTAFYRGVYGQVSRNGTKNYFYEDASFWRLRNIAVGVDVARLMKIKNVGRMQLVLSGRNIVTITKYTGMDPEVSSGSSNSAFDRGVDHNTIPNIKSYQVTLNIGLNN